MDSYEEFAKDYLKWQDEIPCTDKNIELLADELERVDFDISEEQTDNEQEHWDRLDKLNTIADNVCIEEVLLDDGTLMNWETVVNAMDDSIREELHYAIAPCTKQYFYEEYCKQHIAVYHKPFIIN